MQQLQWLLLQLFARLVEWVGFCWLVPPRRVRVMVLVPRSPGHLLRAV